MAVIDDLQATKANLSAQLRSISANPRPNYSVGGQSFSWVDYQKFLMDQIRSINDQINVENPFEEITIGMT